MTPVRATDRLALMNEAFNVLDLLDAQQAQGSEPLSAEAHRTQLVALVQNLAGERGQPHEVQVIAEAVDRWMDAQAVAHPIAPAPGPSLGQRFLGHARALVAHWKGSRATRTLTRGILASVAAAFLIAVPAWGTVLQAPFLFAVHHPSWYLGGLTLVLGVLLTIGIQAHQARNESRTDLVICLLFVSVMLGGLGAAVPNIWAHGEGDARNLQSVFREVNQGLIQFSSGLKPDATATEVIAAGDAAWKNKWLSRHFDPERGVLQVVSEHLNQDECRTLAAKPDAHFQVIEINGQAAPSHALVCPYLWKNDVVFERKVLPAVE